MSQFGFGYSGNNYGAVRSLDDISDDIQFKNDCNWARSAATAAQAYPFTSPRQAGSGMEIWGRLLRARASRLVMYSHGSMPRRRQVSNTLRVAA